LPQKSDLRIGWKKKSSELSGGMQRRLSIAMALIGNPRIIFLDEPTSGLDPTSKRHLWEVLDSYREGRCIILTTHSMEEADTLCGRIGIIAKGRLQCLGSPTHLKNKFGNGYSLNLNSKIGNENTVAEYIQKILPDAKLVNRVGTSSIFKLSKNQFKVSELLKEIESSKNEVGIEDWGISQTSLEEVFISICKEDEPEAQ